MSGYLIAWFHCDTPNPPQMPGNHPVQLPWGMPFRFWHCGCFPHQISDLIRCCVSCCRCRWATLHQRCIRVGDNSTLAAVHRFALSRAWRWWIWAGLNLLKMLHGLHFLHVVEDKTVIIACFYLSSNIFSLKMKWFCKVQKRVCVERKLLTLFHQVVVACPG